MHISKHSKRLLHLSWVVILAGYLLDYLLGSSNPVDGEQTTFYNQIGSVVSYAGYALLLVAMILFFCAPHTHYRATIKSLRNELKPTYEKYRVKSKTVAALLLLLSLPAHAVYYGQASRQVNHYWRLGEQQYKDVNATSDLPTTVAPIVADAFGELYVWHNDRVCPLSVVAEDFCLQLYGRYSYRGMTPMQVMLGYTFYQNEWESTRLKSAKSEELKKQQMLIQQAASAEVYKIFPPLTEDGAWMDWTELDADSTAEQLHRSGMMRQIVEYIAAGKNADAYQALTQLRTYQQQCPYASGLPTEKEFRAEQRLHRFYSIHIFVGLALCIGLCFYLWFIILLSQPVRRRTARGVAFSVTGMAIALALLTGVLWLFGDLSVVCAHTPLCIPSYILFALVVLLNAYALVASFIRSNPQQTSLIIYHLSHLILVPAIFLMAFSLFHGGLWVLITMLVYAAPVHWHPRHQRVVSIRQLRGFHLYLVLAFATVIIPLLC